MFDPFGPSPTKIAAAMRDESEHRIALLFLFHEKVGFTTEEYNAALMQAKSMLDQHVAAFHEKKMEGMTPVQRQIYESLGIDLTKDAEA